MNLEQLKNEIENKIYNEDVLILIKGKSESSKFLLEQYKLEILKLIDKEVIFTEDVQSLNNSSVLLFGEPSFTVCLIDKLDIELKNVHNALIICESINDDVRKKYNDIIIDFPELEKWHIEDFINSKCDGLSSQDTQKIAKLCNYDIFRISNEVDKISLFKKDIQSYILNDLISESFCDDLTEHTMFNLVDAIVGRKLDNLMSIWKDAHLFDSDPMWLLSLLLNQYKVIIDVFLYPNSTPDICGISQKRFNAVKYYYKFYDKNQLIKIYTFLCGVDRKLKSGELSDINLLDYIIVNIMGVR